MANNAGNIRRQVMENSEELQDFLRDLGNWEKDIKRKDQELRTSPNEPKKFPPVRKPIQKPETINLDQTRKEIEKSDDVAEGQKIMKNSNGNENEISSQEFAMEKSDQEKLTEDKNSKNLKDEKKSEEELESSSSEEDREEEELNEMHLKQKALFDKDRGNKFFSEGKYDDAIACYTSGIMADPGNAVLPANRAMALIKKGQLAAAEQDCTLSISVDHRYAKAFFRRGTCRLGLKKLALARQDFLKVMELEPDNKFARIELDKLEQEFKKLDVPQQITVNEQQSSLEHSYSSKQEPVQKKVEPKSRDAIETTPQTTVKQNAATTDTTEVNPKKLKKSAVKDVETKHKKLSIFSNLPHQVKPVYKAAHLKSKSSLQMLSIDVRSSDEEMEEISIPSAAKRPVNLPIRKGETSASSSAKPTPCTPALTPTAPQTLPPVPQTAFQFETDWRRLRHWPRLRTQYLKNIPPATLQHLYHQSMETDIFTDIIHCVEELCVEDVQAAYSFLKSLTKVGRFSTTVLFLSDDETRIVKKVLENASATTDSEDLKIVRSLYGL